MPWEPSDWNGWLRPTSAPTPCTSAALHTVRRILHRLPEQWRTVVRLGDAPRRTLPGTEGRFSCTVTAPLTAGGVSAVSGRFDLALAVDRIVPRSALGAAGVIEGIRDLLSEGGIFLATVAALSPDRAVAPLRLAPRGDGERLPGFHELELHYRLHRAGFQGLRIRRFPAELEHPPALVCMAVRRACN